MIIYIYNRSHPLREPETAIYCTGWCSTLILLLICSSFSSEIAHPVAHLLIPMHRPNYTLGTWEYHKIATELKSNKSWQQKALKGSLCAPFLYMSNVLFEKKTIQWITDLNLCEGHLPRDLKSTWNLKMEVWEMIFPFQLGDF